MSLIALPVACRVDGKAMDGVTSLLPDLQGGPLGLRLGPELLANGGFDTDTVWVKATGWTISGGAASVVSTGTRNLSQSLATLIEGRRYLVTFTVLGYGAGTITPAIVGTPIASGAPRGTNGTFSEILTAGAGPIQFRLQAGLNTILSVDNVSLREVL